VQRFDQVLNPQTHTYQAQWSQAGADALNGPAGAAVDPSGNVFVVDRGNNKAYKFDQFGNFLLAFGGYGSGTGQFVAPSGIAISPDGTKVYVADTNNSRIEVFDSSGNYLSQFGSAGSGNGTFSGPFALATDGTKVYVADTGNSRIEMFDTSGNYLSQFGNAPTLAQPSGIAVDINRQELFIAVDGYSRVDAYTTGGNFIAHLTSVASVNFSMPEQVSTDQRGDVYVADFSNSRIVEFDVNLTRAIAFGTSGNGPGQFDTPWAAVVSPTNGQLYVVDYGNNVVQRWGSPWPKNDTVGVYRPSAKTFFLRNENSTGPADISVYMPYALSGDLPVVGDWTGDGVDTVGLYRPSKARFLLQLTNTQESAPDIVFTLGLPGDTPLAGDWNGQGADGAGIFRPSNGILYLKNSLSTGVADYNLVLGVPGDKGIAGDWNGDGQDSPGVYRPSNERFYVTNKVTNGIVTSDHSAVLGISGDVPFTGDWIAEGFSGIGVFRPTNGVTYEKNTIVTGPADNNFIYGIAGDMPVGGQWIEPSVPFSVPAPHVSLGTRRTAPHPASSSNPAANPATGGGHPAPGHTASGGPTPAATPRRSIAR
jgi:DNA-binding beta-propeller fold protein YncE